MAALAGALRDEPGGIRRLAALIGRHGGALEADLHRYYRTDLLDLWRPESGLTWRKLGVLIMHLPPESATMTGVRAAEPELAAEAAERADPARAPWSHEQMLLAALTDSVRNLAWMFACVNFKGAPKAPPEPISRPGVAPRQQRKGMSVAAYRRLTGQEPPLHLVTGDG